MTTTETSQRVLRRSRTDRIGAGVAGGLGEYFGVDPVLFRVLFATAAFFGGAGVLAYLLAWAVIPEQGTVRAPIDGFVAELRRRRVPVWLVAVAAGLVLWGAAFSWWAPGRFFPVILVVIVLAAIFGRRARPGSVHTGGALASTTAPVSPVRLDKQPGRGAPSVTADPSAEQRPQWVSDTRQWLTEAKAASRERRRRAMPVRIATSVALLGALTVLGICDAVGGIRLPVYFWTGGAIMLLGLLAGAALRRTPWSLAPLLIPAVAGLIAFGNTGASLHDGIGQREFVPTSTSALASHYRLAFGQTTLDLRHLGTLDAARTVDLTMAAGQARILLPATMNATVNAHVHIGVVSVDGTELDTCRYGPCDQHYAGGWNVEHEVLPPSSATGPAVTINVRLADGNVTVEHR